MSDENQQLAVLEHQGTDIDRPLNVQQVLEKVKLIQDVMRQVMKEGEHYGLVPGTGKKASLYKAGAEKLAMTFRLTPRFTITQTDLGNGHRDYNVVCSITNASGAFLAEGVGNCSTMETKYRYRKSEQTCPKCGKDTIIKGKQEYGGGWLCFTKKGGCGEKFEDGDPQIENQNMGRVEHDNPPDYWNTCLKMAKKRAHVDATLTATGASDMFTQDVEDMAGVLQRSDAPADGRKQVPMPQSTEEGGGKHQSTQGGPAGTQGGGKFKTISKPQAKRLFAIGTNDGGLASDELNRLMGERYPYLVDGDRVFLERMKPEDYEAAVKWVQSGCMAEQEKEGERDADGNLKF